MAKSLRKALYVLLALILLIIALNGICGGAFGAPASVASNVLEDLHKDEKFNLNDYPEKPGDYSLNVIQIAESLDGELFIYVYQPAARAKKLVASSINIATVPNSQLEANSFVNYNLTLLNDSGVFHKYKVQGFTLKSDEIRYYNISNILRPYSKEIDDKIENDNTETEVKNAVGQLWTVRTLNGNVEYCNTVSEVIEIENKYVGFLRYYDAQGWTGDYFTDAHFVAFSTDRPMDRLYEIDIEFYKQSRTKEYGALPNKTIDDSTRLGTATKETVTICEYEVDHNSGNKFGYNKYTWKKIRTTSEFLKAENNSYYRITQAGTGGLENTAWAVNFYTSSVKASSTNGVPLTPSDFQFLDSDEAIFQKIESTKVSEVIILRLKFETDGITYNLGAVDNKQTGSDTPANKKVPNKKSWLDILCQWLERITGVPALFWKILICALPFLILLPVLSFIFPGFGKAILWLLKGIFLVIFLPFRAIAALVGKRQEAAPTKATRTKAPKHRTTSRTRKRNTGTAKPRKSTTKKTKRKRTTKK